MKLIDDIKQFPHFLCVQAAVIGGALVAAVVADPLGASQLIGGYVAPQYMPFVAIGLHVLGVLAARAKAQPSLDKAATDDQNANQ